MASYTDKIYVQLMNEGANVYRPAPAYLIAPDMAELLLHDGYDPEDEEWEFKPGSIVRVALTALSGEERLVAIDLVEGERSSFSE